MNIKKLEETAWSFVLFRQNAVNAMVLATLVSQERRSAGFAADKVRSSQLSRCERVHFVMVLVE
jgi:hypothetical protein